MSSSARVLIVDDSRIFRSALEAALSGQEAVEVVGSVFSGQKALEFIQAHPPDVVTLDVEMPGLDGLETLKAIQRFNAHRPPGTEVGVVMVSAHTKRGAEVTMQALQTGAFDFVTKPSGAPLAENLPALQQQLSSKIQLFLAARSRKAATASSPRALAPPRAVPTESAPARAGCRGLVCTRRGRWSWRRPPVVRRRWKHCCRTSAAAPTCPF